MRVFIPTCTSIYWYIPNRHGIIGIYRDLYILYQRNDGFSIVGALLSGRIMHVYTSHIQYNTSWCFKCNGPTGAASTASASHSGWQAVACRCGLPVTPPPGRVGPRREYASASHGSPAALRQRGRTRTRALRLA
jgi:hypothetical protein